MAGIAVRLLAHEQERAGDEARSVATAQLSSVVEKIDLAVKVAQDELMHSLQRFPAATLAENLQSWEEKNPLVRNVFIYDQSGMLLLPNPDFPLTQEQQGFLRRYRSLFNGTYDWKIYPNQEEANSQSSLSMKLYNRAQTKQQISNQVGKWIPWYWENKLGMIGWTQKGPDQPYYGVELEVIALISELHTVLPKNLPATRLMRLVDGRGRTIFQSGDLEIKEGLQPALRLSIGEKLPHWEVQLFTPNGTFVQTSKGILFSNFMAVFLFAILFAAAGLLLREAHRNQIEARQKTTFVSNVSHELKTPLTTIRMYADLLEEGRVADPEKSKHYLHTIVGESQRLSRLVDNMLDFSRLEQNQKKYHIESFDLCSVVEETVQSQQLRLEKAAMSIELLFQTCPCMVQTDRDAFCQALLNLIDNAIKYAADGKKLTVQIESTSTSHRVLVCDAGSGISVRQRRKIFTRFYRADTSITSPTQGCGLGLSIAKHLLTDLGADLKYQPAPNGGACFLITLPIQENPV